MSEPIRYCHPAHSPSALVCVKVERIYTGPIGQIIHVATNGHHVDEAYILEECPDCGMSFDNLDEGCDTCLDLSVGDIRKLEI